MHDEFRVPSVRWRAPRLLRARVAGLILFLLSGQTMLKWLLVVALLVLVSGLLRPGTAKRLRLGRLPGDLAYRFRGREYHFPFATTLLLSLLAWLILRAL